MCLFFFIVSGGKTINKKKTDVNNAKITGSTERGKLLTLGGTPALLGGRAPYAHKALFGGGVGALPA